MKPESQKIHLKLLASIFLLYVFFFIYINLLRLWGFGFSLLDIGIFEQVINNTIHGNYFQTSINYPYKPDGNWLGFHFSIIPIIAAIPFYLIYSGPETLSVLHVLLVSSVSIIIYLTARKINVSPNWALFWSVVYLINPVTTYHVMFSYQETSYYTLLVAIGIYFVVSKRFYPLLATCILLLITKEHCGLSVAGFGVLWAYYNKSYKCGSLISLLGLAAFALVMFVLIPYFSPYNEHFMFTSNSEQGNFSRYQWLMQPLPDVISAAPGKILTPENMWYLLCLFIPMLFLPLGAIFFLFPVGVDILATIFSEYQKQKAVNLYYSAPLIFPAIIASAYTFEKYARNINARKIIAMFIILLNLGSFFYMMEIPLKKFKLLSKNMEWSHGPLFKEAASIIPPEAFLMADENTGYLFANMRKVGVTSNELLNSADYAFIRISPFYYAPLDIFINNIALYYSYELVFRNDWGLVYWKYPYAVFKKGSLDKANRNDLRNAIEGHIRYESKHLKVPD